MQRICNTSLTMLFLFFVSYAAAQNNIPPANPASIDPPSEWGKLKENCPINSALNCVEELFTGPLHIAVGNIAPQNGFAVGAAFVAHKNTDNWRINSSTDAVGTGNSSWRAGTYLSMVHSGQGSIGSQLGSKGVKAPTGIPEHFVWNIYGQGISLNKITYFGPEPSDRSGKSYYGMRETVIGNDAILPLSGRLKIALYGEATGRLVTIRPSEKQSSLSIEQLYPLSSDLNLGQARNVVQFGEGVRMTPDAGLIHLNYSLTYQEYIAPNDSMFSFQRLTVDLGQEVHLWTNSRNPLRAADSISGNGPDECSQSPGSEDGKCPKILQKPLPKDQTTVRDFRGVLGLHFLSTLSHVSSGHVVPFYFQPTLGGSDINGTTSLSSYQDYRFRAPDEMLIREYFEYSIWGPIGVTAMADEGKVGMPGQFRNSPWVHSFSAGLTLRAGGLPMVHLLFSWGGSEGTHTAFEMNSSLLGGGRRPSLY